MCSVGTFSRFKIEGYVEIEWEDIKPIEENWKKYE
jgi:hypothetical protein